MVIVGSSIKPAMMSLDGDTTLTNLNATTNHGSAAANQWGTLTDFGYADLQPGQTARWGAQFTRGGAAGTTMSRIAAVLCGNDPQQNCYFVAVLKRKAALINSNSATATVHIDPRPP